jgi:hypothetical protein
MLATSDIVKMVDKLIVMVLFLTSWHAHNAKSNGKSEDDLGELHFEVWK